MSKYKEQIYELMEGQKPISTFAVLQKLRTDTGKKLGWYIVVGDLTQLFIEKKIEMIETNKSKLWIRPEVKNENDTVEKGKDTIREN